MQRINKRRTNKRTSEWTSQAANQQTKKRINELVNKQTKQRRNEWRKERASEWTNAETNERTSELRNEWGKIDFVSWISDWVNEWDWWWKEKKLTRSRCNCFSSLLKAFFPTCLPLGSTSRTTPSFSRRVSLSKWPRTPSMLSDNFSRVSKLSYNNGNSKSLLQDQLKSRSLWGRRMANLSPY